MPELPEVESVRLQLTRYLVGHKIEKVEIRYQKCFTGDAKKIKRAKVKKTRRFGKLLSIDLSNGFSLLIHIKLTGQLIYRGPKLKKPSKLSEKVKEGLGGKHTHVIFHLDKGGELYYNDVRKFGWIKVVKTSKVEDIDFVKKLGPEPLDGLTLAKFRKLTSSTRRAIKTLIMDQSKIGGVGNIYAIDALWDAKIHPETPANSLKEKKVETLYHSIEKVLKKGLKYGGASELAFVTPDGAEGEYQKHFLAYGQEGKTCPRCKIAKLKKIKVAGRGTVFCPVCQSR